MPEKLTVGTVLAFDFGLKQIGVASGQSITQAGSPLTILSAKNGVPDWRQVEKLVKDWRPDLILVGLPLNMDDSESELSNRARHFARALHSRFNYPIKMVDERLTTREAKNLQSESEGQRKVHLDDVAAALILDSWFQQPSLASDP